MTEPALLQRLADSDPRLHARLDELRETVREWLGYIPATFPHYTRHSIGHSDEIIRQLSSLIFIDSDPDRPASAFTDMELYVLAASAYLHDAGMVASDAEKEDLVGGPEWTDWTQGGPASGRWQEIEALRSRAADEPKKATQLHFAADLQTRFLIAEYVRRNHHLRVVGLLRDQPTLLASADLGDLSLRKTIGDVCLAHGLTKTDLAMDERYPSRRDIQGSSVDVRFMAILLRLGDLLDLSHDRACPLLLNAASPLPPGSIAHWRQYQRIVHRVTSPERLELRAECETQEEHRLLRDWCQWIEDETQDAQILLRQSDRHGTWKPPMARLGEPDPTFAIRPSPTAKYVPVDWRIESDPATVLSRFSSDVYSNDFAFIRELIQNALDASRCRVFAELGPDSQVDGWWTPEALEACKKYPIEVCLESCAESKSESEIDEVKQIVSVRDQGIGMDADRIQQYLLHAGRSFYDSVAFRKQYGFVAASRFGIGFLSVFGVSDRVEVSTKAIGSRSGGGLRLELRGPRNYILVESSDQEEAGTGVAVELREEINKEQLRGVVTSWCTRSEFPVRLTIDGESSTIHHESPGDFETSVSVEAAGVSTLDVLSFPVSSSIARGELYVLQRTDSDGKVRWDIGSFGLREWVEKNAPMLPLVPETPRAMLALHGIETSSAFGGEMALRIDVRASQEERRLNLSRGRYFEFLPTADLGLDGEIERVLNDHFAALDADRRYKANVLRVLSVPWRIAAKIPEIIKVWSQDQTTEAPSSELWSWSDLGAKPEISIAFGRGWPEQSVTQAVAESLGDLGAIVERSEVRWHRSSYGDDEMGIRPLGFCRSRDKKWCVVRCEPTRTREYRSIAIPMSGASFEKGEILVACGLDDSSLDSFFVNRDHPLVERLAVASSRDLEVGERFHVNWTRVGSDPMDVLDLFLAGVRSALSAGVRRRAETDLSQAVAPFLEAAGQKQDSFQLLARPQSHYLAAVYGEGSG